MILAWNPAMIKATLKLSVWLIVAGCLMPLFTCRACLHSPSLYAQVAGLTSVLWVVLWLGNHFLNHELTKRISWIEFPVRRFLFGMLTTVTYTVSTIFIVAFVFEYFTGFSLEKSLVGTLIISVTITMMVTLFIQGRAFLRHWKEETIQSERLQRESIAARYESLKNQVNPHFLFNSLNALTNLVYQDPDLAAKFIKQLSDVYRYVLDTRDREVVSLNEELGFLSSYLFLQQIRFGDKLKVDQQLTYVNSMVAPLALQMLLENAIKHNVVSEEDPLTIRFYAENDFIIVENNILKKSVRLEDSPGVGLDNIRKRYAFLSSIPVTVVETEKSFAVKLPVIQKMQE